MSDESSSTAWKGTVGVLSLLLYLLGSLAFSFVFFNLFVDPEVSVVEGLDRLLAPSVLVASGVVLQAVRQAGEFDDSDIGKETPRPTLRDFAWPLGLMYLPVAAAWLQFEFFRPRIWMWPLPTLIGGVWLGVVQGSFMGRGRFASAITMLIIAVFSLPLAALSVSLPVRHFRNHGSPVVFLAGDDYEEREYPLEAMLPEAPVRELSAMGPGTAELLTAFAEAKPVEGRLIDGEFHVQDESGAWVKVEEGNLDQMFEDAAALDAAAEAEAEAAYLELLEAHARRVDYITRSGRVFSSPPEIVAP